jgi:hypothetical protein
MNRWSRRMAQPRDASRFGERADGPLCPNNLYLASLIFPVIAPVPGLILWFSWAVLAAVVGLVLLLAFRFFVVFPRVACAHCRAKNACPNARAMNLA